MKGRKRQCGMMGRADQWLAWVLCIGRRFVVVGDLIGAMNTTRTRQTGKIGDVGKFVIVLHWSRCSDRRRRRWRRKSRREIFRSTFRKASTVSPAT